MNAPTHMACAACIASFMASRADPGMQSRTMLLCGAVAAGMLSHILLDLTPHYAWIVYLDWLGSQPYSGVLRELILGGAAAILALLITSRTDTRVVLAGMIGSAYLDIEKVAALGLGLPPAFVLFDWHSLQVSSHPTYVSKAVLIALESVILIASFVGLLWIRHSARLGMPRLGQTGDGNV